jgi:hypothetical protein
LDEVCGEAATIAHHDATAPMTGGNVTLTGGFWALSALQTPAAPLLSIQLTSTNTVQIFWPSPSPGFNLQVNPTHRANLDKCHMP